MAHSYSAGQWWEAHSSISMSSLRTQGPITTDVCCRQGNWPHLLTGSTRRMGFRFRGDDVHLSIRPGFLSAARLINYGDAVSGRRFLSIHRLAGFPGAARAAARDLRRSQAEGKRAIGT